MMLKKKGFTLVEVLLAITIASSIIVIVYSLLDTLPKVKNFNDTRQTLIQQMNDAMDRFSILFQNYTIDYEEYYNRRAVGCTPSGGSGNSFTWEVGYTGYCTIPTGYGNWHGSDTGHMISYNGSISVNPPYSYGEYKWSFWNFGEDTDGTQIGQKPPEFGDADDRDLGDGDVAVGDSENVQELYLISHDKTRRIFLRRKFNPYTNGQAYGSSGWYSIQILKLRGFDAGNLHNFSNPTADLGVYDGQVDTWACDKGQFFDCHGDPVSSNNNVYQGYRLPSDNEDGWVNLFDEKLDILDWNLEVYPIKDQDLAWGDTNQQINPYFKLTITAGLSNHLFSNRNWGGTGGFTYTLENIFDTKGFYIQ